MIVITEPAFPWQSLNFQCSRCKGVVQFEISDMTGLKGIKPRQGSDGRWIVVAQCEWDRTVETFTEIAT